MKYIPVHIGDWIKHTHTLSAAEEGFYWRACVWCYLHEKPLPMVFKETCKELRAHTRQDVAIVQGVLDRFFELTERGFVNHRIEEVIAKAKAKNGGVGHADQSHNQLTRQQRHRLQRANMFFVLEKAGITAPWNSTTTHLRALISTHGLTCAEPVTASHDAPVTRPVTRSRHGYVNCEPVNSDKTLSRLVTAQRAPDLADAENPAQTADPAAQDQPTETVTPTPAARAARAMKAAGLSPVNPGHPDLTTLLAAGCTVETLAFAAAEAVARGKGFPYALAIAKSRHEDAVKGGPAAGGDLLDKWAPGLRRNGQ